MLTLLLSLVSPVLANGQTTHLWISATAIGHVEDESLAELLTEHASLLALGTMFPDGGYAIGHPYAETAHWEPFQDDFRDWIIDNYDDLSSPDAAAQVAFYMGLASHGMADQVFDSMYMERSRAYDADDGWSVESASLDTSQDVVFAHLTYPHSPPPDELPSVLPEIFERHGVEVDMDTLTEGQRWLDLAVEGVAGMSEADHLVDQHMDAFPWGCSHLLSEDVPGAPPFEARVVAKYWESLWATLNGQSQDLSVIGWWPLSDAHGHPRQADDVEARLSLVFNRGLYDAEVNAGSFQVESSSVTVPINLDLFYRDDSHVVNIAPVDEWMDEAAHGLTVEGLSGTDGRGMASPFALTFHTGAEPIHDEDSDELKDCGCAQARGAHWVWFSGLLILINRRRSSD